MEESAIKGLKLLELNDADIPKPRSVSAFSIEGFETWRQSYLLGLEVEKHFASCGKFQNIRFIQDSQYRIINSVAYMRIEGEGAEDKALALSGTDVGGWTALVKAAPKNIMTTLDRRVPVKTKRVVVRGYDTTWLPEIDIQMALCKHFSSCGVVTNVMLLPKCGLAYIDIHGESCVGKALELSGRNLGGMTLVVELIPTVPPPQNTGRRPKRSCTTTGYMHPRFLPEVMEMKMEMEKEKEKEMAKKMKMMMEMKMEKKKEKEKKMKIKMEKKMEMEMDMKTLS